MSAWKLRHKPSDSEYMDWDDGDDVTATNADYTGLAHETFIYADYTRDAPAAVRVRN